MTREEAKVSLQAYRPDSADADDPVFAEAIALLEQDSELQEWFEQEQAFDRAMIRHFRSIQPPANLKAEILAGMRAAAQAAQAGDDTEKVIALEEKFEPGLTSSAPQKPWYAQWIPLAAAAAVLIAIGASIPMLMGPQGQPGQVPELIAYLSDDYNDVFFSLDFESSDVNELKAYLASHDIPAGAGIPTNLVEMSPIGCKTLEFQNTPIGMICFREAGLVYHLYTTNVDVLNQILPEISPTDMPVYISDGKTAYKVWTDNQNVNILSRKGDVDELKAFF